MLSMTGFGQGEASLSHGKALVELRAVNHRFLDLRVRAPRLPATAQFVVEQVLKQRAVRGHIDAFVSLHGTGIDAPTLDRERARSAWAELQALRDEIDPAATLPLTLLSIVPDLFVAHPAFDEAALQLALTQATEAACKELHRMRLIEGEALQDALLSMLSELQEVVRFLEAGQGDALEQARRRLAERVDNLLGPHSGKADRGRLEQEIALLAQRADIAEEIARIFSHTTQLTQIVRPGSEPTGKRADFLLQELAREVNTIGAKLQDASLAKHVITLKSLVERMREQVQNVL